MRCQSLHESRVVDEVNLNFYPLRIKLCSSCGFKPVDMSVPVVFLDPFSSFVEHIPKLRFSLYSYYVG